MQSEHNGDGPADEGAGGFEQPGAGVSHDMVVDSLGRMSKYVYDNPETGRAVAVLNCSHQFVQEFVNGEAEVKASLDFRKAPDNDRPVMKLSVVVMLRKDQPEVVRPPADFSD